LFVQVGVHELFHLNVLRFFGGDGIIGYDLFGNGYVHFTKLPPESWMLTVVAFAGGIGMALWLGMFIWLDWHDDYEQALPLIPIFLSQLAYGIFEGFFVYSMPLDRFFEVASWIAAVTLPIGFVISLLLFVKNLADKYFI
jgi:hypothetical protein